MLLVGQRYPRATAWTYSTTSKVDMQPWRFGIPCAITLLSCVVGLYLLFSPIGLVGGISTLFWPLICILVVINIVSWVLSYRRETNVLKVGDFSD